MVTFLFLNLPIKTSSPLSTSTLTSSLKNSVSTYSISGKFFIVYFTVLSSASSSPNIASALGKSVCVYPPFLYHASPLSLSNFLFFPFFMKEPSGTSAVFAVPTLLTSLTKSPKSFPFLYDLIDCNNCSSLISKVSIFSAILLTNFWINLSLFISSSVIRERISNNPIVAPAKPAPPTAA